MDSKEVIFFEDDYMLKSFDAFVDMRRNEELVDFRITLENRSIFGHQLVLAARIPHFRKLLCSFQQELTLSEVDPDALELVINFAYTGKIKITLGNVVSLLSVSKVLKLTHVTDACWEFLERRLNSNNVLEFRKLAEDHGCSEFLEAADNYIRQNFEEFSNSESFLSLPFLQLKETISRNDIRVSAEEKVFESVIRWVKTSEAERRDLLPELLSAVRMYFLTPAYLIEKVSTEELIQSSLHCRDLLDEAKSYHLLPVKRARLHGLQSQRRLYLLPEQGSSVSNICHFYPHAERSLVYCFYRNRHATFIVKLFDPENRKWLNLSSYDSAEAIDAVVSLDGEIYVFATRCIHKFNVHTYKWSSSENEENVRASGNVTYNGKIYFFGGFDYDSATVRCFDPREGKFYSEYRMRKALLYPGVSLVYDFREDSLASMYITGGKFEENVYNSTERYNPETKQWTKLSPMFSKRYDHGSCDLNFMIYVCGGLVSAQEPLSSAEVYSPVTDQWSFISSMLGPRCMASVFSHDYKLYVCGKRRQLSVRVGNLEIYDPTNDEWKPGVSIPEIDIRMTDKVFIVTSIGIRGNPS